MSAKTKSWRTSLSRRTAPLSTKLSAPPLQSRCTRLCRSGKVDGRVHPHRTAWTFETRFFCSAFNKVEAGRLRRSNPPGLSPPPGHRLRRTSRRCGGCQTSRQRTSAGTKSSAFDYVEAVRGMSNVQADGEAQMTPTTERMSVNRYKYRCQKKSGKASIDVLAGASTLNKVEVVEHGW